MFLTFNPSKFSYYVYILIKSSKVFFSLENKEFTPKHIKENDCDSYSIIHNFNFVNIDNKFDKFCENLLPRLLPRIEIILAFFEKSFKLEKISNKSFQ